MYSLPLLNSISDKSHSQLAVVNLKQTNKKWFFYATIAPRSEDRRCHRTYNINIRTMYSVKAASRLKITFLCIRYVAICKYDWYDKIQHSLHTSIHSLSGRGATGGALGARAPPGFHTLAEEMSLKRGVTHFTLGIRSFMIYPSYYKYTFKFT